MTERAAKRKAVEVIELSSEEDEEEYDVDEIIGKRGSGKKLEYHVKWQGYDASNATWEPAANLKADGCQEFIDAFEKKSGKVGTTVTKEMRSKSAGKQKAVEKAEVKPSVARKQPAAAAKPAKKQKSGAATPAVDDEEDVLLGHIISKCVGIQHYHGNGVRFNKEPFRLRREPNNPYDRNAVAVLNLPQQLKVGHVQRIDALAIARVADDTSMSIRMVGQVESGAQQMYKFPLRISFFGRPEWREKVSHHLRMGGVALEAPKQRKSKSGLAARTNAASASAAGSSSTTSARAKSGGVRDGGKSSGVASMSASADDDDDQVEFTHEKTWAERDAELRAQAVVLD
jgi:hypothetical protein